MSLKVLSLCSSVIAVEALQQIPLSEFPVVSEGATKKAGQLYIEECSDGFCNNCTTFNPPVNQCIPYKGASYEYSCVDDKGSCGTSLFGAPGTAPNTTSWTVPCGKFVGMSAHVCGQCVPYDVDGEMKGYVISCDGKKVTVAGRCEISSTGECSKCGHANVIPTDGTCVAPENVMPRQWVSTFPCPKVCTLKTFNGTSCEASKLLAVGDPFPSGSCEGFAEAKFTDSSSRSIYTTE